MGATTIRYRGKVVNHDPMTNPENGYVEGFYYQDLDNGVVKHYIFNCPMTWEVDPSTVRVCHAKDKYVIRRVGNTILKGYSISCVLEFPTEEMRDAFFENFKDLIKSCKELL